MMNVEIVSAENPRRMEWDETSITLDVLFSHEQELMPFTAKADDLEKHGRELYVRALRGEYGEIAVIATPKLTDEQQRARLDNALKQAAAIMAPLEDAEKLGIASEEELSLLAAWRLYRVEVYRLPQSAGWPADVTWPEQPS